MFVAKQPGTGLLKYKTKQLTQAGILTILKPGRLLLSGGLLADWLTPTETECVRGRTQLNILGLLTLGAHAQRGLL